jgi:hypothetical protein
MQNPLLPLETLGMTWYFYIIRMLELLAISLH